MTRLHLGKHARMIRTLYLAQRSASVAKRFSSPVMSCSRLRSCICLGLWSLAVESCGMPGQSNERMSYMAANRQLGAKKRMQLTSMGWNPLNSPISLSVASRALSTKWSVTWTIGSLRNKSTDMPRSLRRIGGRSESTAQDSS